MSIPIEPLQPFGIAKVGITEKLAKTFAAFLFFLCFMSKVKPRHNATGGFRMYLSLLRKTVMGVSYLRRWVALRNVVRRNLSSAALIANIFEAGIPRWRKRSVNVLSRSAS